MSHPNTQIYTRIAHIELAMDDLINQIDACKSKISDFGIQLAEIKKRLRPDDESRTPA